MKDVTDRLRDQTVKVTDDLDELRKSGLKGMWAYIVRLGGGLFKKRNKKQHEKKHKE
jgi:hypothetical protein